MKQYGTLYGIGVGPGDPQMLTLQALNQINQVDVIAVPGEKKEETVAYQIVLPVAEALDQKECLELKAPMIKDKTKLNEIYDDHAKRIARYLENGQDVAFLTLGDPTVYSTYMYLHHKVLELGYPARIISGIPSFCAAAARLNISLVEQHQQLHVFPSCYDLQEELQSSGTKVLMKTGSKMKEVKEALIASGQEVMMVENCGMENEKIYHSAEAIDETAGYYSLIIAKEK